MILIPVHISLCLFVFFLKRYTIGTVQDYDGVRLLPQRVIVDWPWGCRCDIGKYSAKYGRPSDSSPHRAQTGPPVHITSQQRGSRFSWSPGGIRFQLLCFSSLFFFLLSPSLWLCCYFLVVVGDGDSRWLLGTLAHWCACQTARRRTTVSQPPPPHPSLQFLLIHSCKLS